MNLDPPLLWGCNYPETESTTMRVRVPAGWCFLYPLASLLRQEAYAHMGVRYDQKS